LYTIKAAFADDVEFHFRFFLLRPPMALVKYYPMGIIGCDKFSCPGNNKILKEKYFFLNLITNFMMTQFPSCLLATLIGREF
jgi:hypothetical protein